MPASGQVTIPLAQVNELAATGMQLGQIILKELNIELASLEDLVADLAPQAADVVNPRYRIWVTPSITVSISVQIAGPVYFNWASDPITLPTYDSQWQSLAADINILTQALHLSTGAISFGPLRNLTPAPIARVTSGGMSAGGVQANATSLQTGMVSLLGTPLTVKPFPKPTTGQMDSLTTQSLKIAGMSVPEIYVPHTITIPNLTTGGIDIPALNASGSLSPQIAGTFGPLTVGLTFDVEFAFKTDKISLTGITGKLSMQGLKASMTTFSAELQGLALQELQLLETLIGQINIPV